MASSRFDACPAPYRGIGSELARWLGTAWLTAFGWKVRGDWPGLNKAVLVAAPHTSNWDGLHMIATAAYYRIRLRWMGKKALGKGVFGAVARRAGLVPVDRSGGNEVVADAVAAMQAADTMILAVAPEGTRSYAADWKSGFYHIAHGAGVPILMAVLDYGARTITLAGPVETTGEQEADLRVVQAPYLYARGLKNDRWNPLD